MADTSTPAQLAHLAAQTADNEGPLRTAEAAPAPAPPAEAAAPLSGPEVAPDGKPAPLVKVAIVGYTPTCLEALPLLDNPEWLVWGMNTLHLQPVFTPHVGKFNEWFDLHPESMMRSDPGHLAWLEKGTNGVPVWVWQARPEWPTTKPYPRDEVTNRFGNYFTNTVSWQLAMALLRIMTQSPDGLRAPDGATIAVYGIDMATGTEYSAQRPSVEYFLGIAAGAGIEIVLPERSDLLKCHGLYGIADSGLRAKLEERDEQLRAQHAQASQQLQQLQQQVAALSGAIESNAYIMGVWTQPNIDRNAPQNAVAQDGAAAPTPPAPGG